MSHDFDDDVLQPRASRPPSGPVMVHKGGAARMRPLAGVRAAMVALVVSSAACSGDSDPGGDSQTKSNINGKTPTSDKTPPAVANGADDQGKVIPPMPAPRDGGGDSDAGMIAPMPAPGDGDSGGDGGHIIPPMPPPVDAGNVIPDAGIIVVPPMPPPPMPEP
jgi:hypothetical protein